jgi:hypothetical protein
VAEDWQPYTIERAGRQGRIRLGPEAKFWAEQHGMTLTEFARYLLQRDEQGDVPAQSTDEDFLPNVTPQFPFE